MKRTSDNCSTLSDWCQGSPPPKIINLRSRRAIEIGLVLLTSFGLKTNIEISYQSLPRLFPSQIRGFCHFLPAPTHPLSQTMTSCPDRLKKKKLRPVSSFWLEYGSSSPAWVSSVLGSGACLFPAASSPPSLLLEPSRSTGPRSVH